MSAITPWAKKRILLAFFVPAYALSGMVEIPLALKAQGITRAIDESYDPGNLKPKKSKGTN
jgi:hypothetical protein